MAGDAGKEVAPQQVKFSEASGGAVQSHAFSKNL